MGSATWQCQHVRHRMGDGTNEPRKKNKLKRSRLSFVFLYKDLIDLLCLVGAIVKYIWISYRLRGSVTQLQILRSYSHTRTHTNTWSLLPYPMVLIGRRLN